MAAGGHFGFWPLLGLWPYYRGSVEFKWSCPVATWLVYSRAFQPVAHGPHAAMRPARQYCAAREVIYVLIVLAELMKYWNQKVLYCDLRLNYSTVVAYIIGLINKILRRIYKTPLILLHAARLQTWVTCVWPAVDLSWKALVYSIHTVKLFLLPINYIATKALCKMPKFLLYFVLHYSIKDPFIHNSSALHNALTLFTV